MPKLIGKNANQVPVNGYLGNMAFQDKASVEVDELTVTGKALVGGDTSAGDNAAIGYTATEGLILTGQGSTNDVTIKNDADAAVARIPTGTTNFIMAGASGNIGFEDGTTDKGIYWDSASLSLYAKGAGSDTIYIDSRSGTL